MLDDHGSVGCHSSRSNDLSVYARNGHVATFEVKLGRKTKRTITESPERSAEQLFDTLELVALAVEHSKMLQWHTKKRQLVTRSGLRRLRCCVGRDRLGRPNRFRPVPLQAIPLQAKLA